MNSRTIRGLVAVASNTHKLRRRSPIRLLKLTLDWMIVLGGLVILIGDLGRAIAPWMHEAADAIRRAMT